MDIKQYIAMTGSGVQVKGSPYHKGGEIDIDGKIGDPVMAYTDGRVVRTGFNKDYGNFVVVQDPTGKDWLYGHLDGIGIKENAQVRAGQTFLGPMGNTGKTIAGNGGDGSHVHLEQINGNIPMGKKSYIEFAKAIKAKFPEYKDADDLKLAQAMIAKFPEYAQQVDLGGGEENGHTDLNVGFSTAPAPTFGAGDQTNPVQNDIKDLSIESAELGGTVADKASGLIHGLNEQVKNPGVGLRTAAKFPGELIHQLNPVELAKNAVEPVTKGIASGVRALEATPKVAQSVGGLIKDLWNDKLENEKGEKVSIAYGLKHPFKTYVPSAEKHVKDANKTLEKPVAGQKTMQGDSTAGNLNTAATAGLAALGVKNPGVTSGVLKGLTSGAGTVSKAVAKGGLGLLKGAVKGVLPTGAGILGYLLGRN